MNPAELKALRKGAGLTQGQLAHEIGVSRVFVGLMERGLATIERRTDLAVRHVIEGARPAATSRASRKCGMCDDTGYKDYAGFAMDPCDHRHPSSAPEAVADPMGWRAGAASGIPGRN